MSTSSNQKEFCNSCNSKTNHKTLIAPKTRENNEIIDENVNSEYITYHLLECLGCNSIQLKIEKTRSNSKAIEIEYYPINERKKLSPWFKELDDKYYLLLKEIYFAMNNNLNSLALMGSRTIFDHLFIDKVGDKGNFQDKIKEMLNKGYISEGEKDTIQTVIDAGNASAHRGYCPETKHLETVLDVMENILYRLFIIKDKAQDLKNSVPKRKWK